MISILMLLNELLNPILGCFQLKSYDLIKIQGTSPITNFSIQFHCKTEHDFNPTSTTADVVVSKYFKLFATARKATKKQNKQT
jgi:hypothetical protein